MRAARALFPTFFVTLMLATSGIASAAVTEWVDMEIANGKLLIASEINGVKGFSMIDTGASSTSINGRFVDEYNPEFGNAGKVTVQGVVGSEERPVYRGVEVTMFGAPLTFNNVMNINFGPKELQLLLGADFMKGYIVQFDYTNERMRLITRDSMDLKDQRNIKSKRMRTSGGILVQVNLGKKEPWLLLDTGANGGLVVSRALAQRLDWPDNYESTEGTVTGVTASANTEYFRLPNMGIGPYNLENVLATYPAEGSNFAMFESQSVKGTRLKQKRKYEGVIGYDVLKHFLVTVDYQRGYVHLAPGQKEPAE